MKRSPRLMQEDFSSFPEGHPFAEGTWHTTPSGMFFRANREVGSPVYPPNMHIARNETDDAVLSMHLGPVAEPEKKSTHVYFGLRRVAGRRISQCVFEGVRTRSPGPEPTTFTFAITEFLENGLPYKHWQSFDIDYAGTDIVLDSLQVYFSLDSVEIEAGLGIADVPPIEIGGMRWSYTDWGRSIHRDRRHSA